MNRDEYVAFLKYLYARYAQNKTWSMSHNERRWRYFPHQLDRAYAALRITDYIRRYTASDSEIYETFKADRLREVAEAGSGILGLCRGELDRTGLTQILEEYYDELLEGVTPEDLPAEELRIIADMGRVDPQGELAAVIHILKVRARHEREVDRRRERGEREIRMRIRRILKDGEEVLDASVEETWWEWDGSDEEPPEGKKPAKGRTWFSRLGEILEGGVYVIGDIAVAASSLLPQVPPGIEPWRALASVRVGVGLAVEGIKGIKDGQSDQPD